MTTTQPPVQVIPAPPDLAALIDDYRNAWTPGGATYEVPGSWSRTHWALVGWKGWKKRTRYVHGGITVALIWGSLSVTGIPGLEGKR